MNFGKLDTPLSMICHFGTNS